MALENKLGITSSAELAREEERISKKKAIELFEKGLLDKMEADGITQKQLAERMDCSQQYVSKILKGCENLSLETMAKIECALGITVMQCELSD